ncbi:hypothetical protein FRC0457_01966 [Corynebacterium diphtheriae]|nr:hypothetical protein FRC0457_01966 [Corynebacterium diphtheriae]
MYKNPFLHVLTLAKDNVRRHPHGHFTYPILIKQAQYGRYRLSPADKHKKEWHAMRATPLYIEVWVV